MNVARRASAKRVATKLLFATFHFVPSQLVLTIKKRLPGFTAEQPRRFYKLYKLLLISLLLAFSYLLNDLLGRGRAVAIAGHNDVDTTPRRTRCLTNGVDISHTHHLAVHIHLHRTDSSDNVV